MRKVTRELACLIAWICTEGLVGWTVENSMWRPVRRDSLWGNVANENKDRSLLESEGSSAVEAIGKTVGCFDVTSN